MLAMLMSNGIASMISNPVACISFMPVDPLVTKHTLILLLRSIALILLL